jgi:IMP dehydrogenase
MGDPEIIVNPDIDGFFRWAAENYLGITFDDVLIRPRRSDVVPNSIESIKGRFGRRTPLLIPIVSAAMDTLTEHKTARRMSIEGGLGIIHRHMSAKQQGDEVDKTKFYRNRKIEHPITIEGHLTVEGVKKLREEKEFEFTSFPVVGEHGRVKGLVAKKELEFYEDEPEKPIRDIMITNPVTATPDTDVRQAYALMKEKGVRKLLLVDGDNVLHGMYTWADVQAIVKNKNPLCNTDENGQLRVGAAVGVNDDERVELLMGKSVDVIVIDSAHAHTEGVIRSLELYRKALERYKSDHPEYEGDIVVGNIGDAEAAEDLIKAGADGVKVGIGPGSICTTRIISGVGVPQLTAGYECYKVAKKHGVPVCIDGGGKYSGDLGKAIAVGAESIMLGGMLAGTDECPGEVVLYKGRPCMVFRGMGSLEAMMQKEGGGRYHQRGTPADKLVPEGVEKRIPFKGPLAKVLFQIVGGLKNTMGYLGARTIEEMMQNVRFLRQSGAGQVESHPRGDISSASPNYPIGGDE